MSERVIDGLPPSFHQSFLPERRHLSSLLRLAATGFEGAIEPISVVTGIPTGKSSGKIVPHLKYASAMGLIKSASATQGTYRLGLTSLGKEVAKEDALLHEDLTQLILHLMLARPVGGAAVWHVFFGMSRLSLGQESSIEAATSFLCSTLGKSSSIPGPLFAAYREESSLARSGMLAVEQSRFKRGCIPANPDYYWGLASCWLSYWEHVAPDEQQLALSKLEAMTGFLEITGWTRSQYDGFLSWAVDHRIAKVDRQTGEPLILRTTSSPDLAARIYSELI